jgi:hypothetical protein
MDLLIMQRTPPPVRNQGFQLHLIQACFQTATFFIRTATTMAKKVITVTHQTTNSIFYFLVSLQLLILSRSSLFSWNWEVHYCIYKSSPFNFVQSQLNPVHSFTPLGL